MLIAILFDFDGTLVDLKLKAPLIRKELEEFYKSHGYDIKVGRITRTIESGPPELKKEAWDILKKHELASVPTSLPVPGAVEAVKWARTIGKVGIVSLNSEEAIKKALAYHNFPPVDVIVGRTLSRKPKPAPDGILVALRILGIPPSTAVMVGDSDSDMMAARSAGVVAIGFPRTKFSRETLIQHGANYIIRDYGELQSLIRRIFSISTE